MQLQKDATAYKLSYVHDISTIALVDSSSCKATSYTNAGRTKGNSDVL